MINISRNAWYIRYISNVIDTKPTNLCQLIRYFIGATGSYLVVTVIILLFAFFVTYPFGYAFDFYESSFIAMCSIIFDGVLVIIGVRQYYENLPMSKQPNDIHIIPNLGFFSLLYKYIKAVHDKTCPLIKVE